jgi:ABC-2 type transport system permease protein
MTSTGKALTIARTSLRRLFRDRSNIFFVLIFPMLLVLVIGSIFGGGFTPPVGVVAPPGDPLAEEIVDSLAAQESLTVVDFESEDDLLGSVERGGVGAGVVIPDGYGDALAAGDDVEIGFVARPDGVGPLLLSNVRAAIAPQSGQVQAARFAESESGADFDAALERATDLQASIPAVTVETTTAGDEIIPASLGRFDLGASTQILLFMFVTSLAGSAALIQSRQLGVSKRMLSTPTSTGTILTGEAVGRLAVVLFQGLYIMGVSWLVFDVDWGNGLGALSLVFAFALVGAGAGMLMGAVFRNDQQAGAVGVVVGLGMAALGGCMTPLEFFPDTMQRIAHVTPHAWAVDGFAELVRRGGTVADITTELAVLLVMATVLLTLATWRLRVALVR